MDEFFAVLVLVVVLTLDVFGTIFIAGDFRHFDDITKQCVEQGYIQNRTTRIICHKEVQP